MDVSIDWTSLLGSRGDLNGPFLKIKLVSLIAPWTLSFIWNFRFYASNNKIRFDAIFGIVKLITTRRVKSSRSKIRLLIHLTDFNYPILTSFAGEIKMN